ncbi:flavodoxin domain-containing protein [Nocardia sp. NPDC049149]|uniref:flavodoxin domain-containing protein n=1 Tax=Nocardia sp. NPDC049149 TaxID=3364315 RepID=UPI0037124F01
MRSRVVYESMFGNTAAVAEAIAAGLRTQGTVEVLTVAEAANTPAPTVDLLVVGGPTHAFGLSRKRTRLDAAEHTDKSIAVEIGIREWLDAALPVTTGRRAAAFCTKVAKPPWLPGSAAHGAGKRLRRLGYELADDPADFLVDGMTGPLADGELARAQAWAERLAYTEHDRLAHRH